MIETKSLLLRPIESKDRHSIFVYRSDKSANKYQGWIPETLHEVDDFIASNPKRFNQPDTWFQLIIVEKNSKVLIGDIGLHFLGKENKQVEIGCTLNARHQGKGLATEAMQGCITHLFRTLEKHRITASVDPRNTRSINLVERLGFRKEAHFKESILVNDKWVDDIVYALLKSEWEPY